MATEQRIEELKQYVRDWEDALETVTRIRDRLMQDRERGLTLLEKEGNDVLPDRILEADKAVRQHHQIVINMTARRDRAIAGDYV